MTPTKRLAYLFNILMQEGRVRADMLIAFIEMIVRSNQDDVARAAEACALAGSPWNEGRALRLAVQLIGDEAEHLQRPMTAHDIAEERSRLESRERALLIQRGWVPNGSGAPHSERLWRKHDAGETNTAGALHHEALIENKP